jgi:hypothetical protein
MNPNGNLMSADYHMKLSKVNLMSAMLILTSIGGGVDAQTYTPEQIRQAIRASGGPEPFMRRIAEDSARIFPRVLDAETEGFMAVQHGRSLVYQIRLLNRNRADIPDLNDLKERVTRLNAPAVCSGPVARILITEHAASYKYIVYSKTKEYLFEYAVDQNLCRKLGLT